MKPETFSIAKYFPVLLLVVFFSFFAHLGSLPLFDFDEGAYSEVTREMLANNDFTSSLLNDIPFPHKPPLFFWAQAASIKIFGINEFGLRLPSAVAALLWAASIFLFTRRCFDTKSAWYTTLFMTSSLLVTLIGRAATPEAMTNLFLTLTLLNIYRYYHSGSKRHIYWSFMFAAMGVLTKGSIAILFPVVVGLLFFSLKKRWKNLLQLLFNPIGLIVFGLIVIPWYLAQFMLYGEAFLSDLFLLQQTGVSSFNFIGSTLPYYTYPVLLLAGLLPFTGFLFKAFSQFKSLIADDLIKYMAVWFLVTVLLLPLSQPKSPFSLGYSCTPLFIIMARTAASFRHAFNLFIWPLLLIAFLCVIADLSPYLTGLIGSVLARNLVTESLVYFDAYFRLTLGAILLLLTILPFMKPAPSSTKYAILGLLFVGMVHFLVLPVLGSTLQQPIKTAAQITKREKLKVITWQNNSPSFNVYAEMLTERRKPEPGDIILTRNVYLENSTSYETLFEKHGLILAKIK